MKSSLSQEKEGYVCFSRLSQFPCMFSEVELLLEGADRKGIAGTVVGHRVTAFEMKGHMK